MAQNERSFRAKRTSPVPRAPGRRAPGAPGRDAKARPRRGAADDKRERILRAAIKVFARKGFYAARVSEIAKAAGVADGTIYLYFANKDDVLVRIFEDRIVKLIATLERELAAASDTSAKIRCVIELQLGLLEGRRDLAEVITVNLRQSSRLLKQYAAPLFNRYLETIAGVFAEGQAAKVVRDDVHPMILARALWGSLDGLALTWALGKAEPGGLKRAANQLATVFLAGVAIAND